jgi:thiosulfate reductase cytochrome b subunit
MARTYVYSRFNRFWHWLQALLVTVLLVTGLEVHYPGMDLFGFARAVEIHRVAAWSFAVLIVFAIFWHVVTGAWHQYVPTRRFLPEMIGYYLSGIFRGKKKPVAKTAEAKLNPLQRIVYTGLKILIIPVLVTTGFLYLFHNELAGAGFGWISLGVIAAIHMFAALLMLAFMIAHIYLVTTGKRPLDSIKAMITGWEDLDE